MNTSDEILPWPISVFPSLHEFRQVSGQKGIALAHLLLRCKAEV